MLSINNLLSPQIIVVGGSRLLRDMLVLALKQHFGNNSVSEVAELYDLFVLVNLDRPYWLVFLSEVELADVAGLQELPFNLMSIRDSGQELQVQWADGSVLSMVDLNLEHLVNILDTNSRAQVSPGALSRSLFAMQKMPGTLSA